MYDLIKDGKQEYTGTRTGIVFGYKQPGMALKNEITSLISKGGLEAIEAESLQAMPQMRIAALRSCLVSVSGLEANGVPFEVVTDRGTLGGFAVDVVTDQCLEALAGGAVGSDLLELADYIIHNMEAAVEEKKELAGQ